MATGRRFGAGHFKEKMMLDPTANPEIVLYAGATVAALCVIWGLIRDFSRARAKPDYPFDVERWNAFVRQWCDERRAAFLAGEETAEKAERPVTVHRVEM